MNSASFAVVAAILSSVLSSLAFMAEKVSVKHLSAELTTSALGLVSAAILFGYCAIRKKLPTLRALAENRKDLIALCIFRSILGTLLICKALTLSPTIKVMFFTKLEPYFVMFWFWLAGKQTVQRKHLMLLAVHVVGAILLSTGGKFALDDSQVGDLLVVAAMACISYAYVNAATLSHSLGPIVTNASSGLLAGVIVLPIGIMLAPASAWSLDSPGWPSLLIVVLMFNVVALSLWFFALKHIPGWIVSAVRASGPIFAAPVAYLITGETLNDVQMLGAITVLVTSALIVKERGSSLPQSQSSN